MARQLRLDVAQLTDVGRKREHNEDNMAHVIPKDPQVMTRKGALFIVADGMGGHAAGEVASEIAVDTVSNVYYQEEGDDVVASLVHAIKRANTQIHQRAAENMLRSGMGTTCVAAVLRGNMAYIANVGDSRAYLLRNNQVKQVTQDHSWVAEQVRVGLLTEEQARTHAQRNVITRCLGTQAEVDIDMFSERLEENDTLVLCTDGLSGLVGDEDLLHIVERATPQESVYHLVERANQNGGPDNITAIVVRVEEVGWEPSGSLRRPVPVGGRENTEDTAILGQLPGASVSGSNRVSEYPTPGTARPVPSGPLPATVNMVPAPIAVQQPKRRRRLLYSTGALGLLFVILVVSLGLFYYQRTSDEYSVNQKLSSAQNEITQANTISANNPAQALQHLASAQNILQSLTHSSLSSDQQRRVMNVLQGDFTHEVRNAIASYNNAAKIVTVPCQSPPTVLDASASNVQIKVLAQVDNTKNSSLFALSNDGNIYQFTSKNTSVAPLKPALFSAPTQAISMVGDGSQLALLLSTPGKTVGTHTYSIALWSPGQSKALTMPVDANLLKPGFMPTLITTYGSDVYIVMASANTTTALLDYPLKNGKFSAPPKPSQFSSSPIASITTLSKGQLVLLLANGQLMNLSVAPGVIEPTSVLVNATLLPPLPVSADAYTWQTRVPSVPNAALGAPGNHQPLAIPMSASAPAAILADVVDNTEHIYIQDTSAHRALDFTVASQAAGNEPGVVSTTPTAQSTVTHATPTSTANSTTPASSSSITLQLQQQYVSASVFAQMIAMSVDPQNNYISVLAANSKSALQLTTFGSGAQNGCSQP